VKSKNFQLKIGGEGKIDAQGRGMEMEGRKSGMGKEGKGNGNGREWRGGEEGRERRGRREGKGGQGNGRNGIWGEVCVMVFGGDGRPCLLMFLPLCGSSELECHDFGSNAASSKYIIYFSGI
jgi:hypothetical protein